MKIKEHAPKVEKLAFGRTIKWTPKEEVGKGLASGHDPHAGVKHMEADPETLKSGANIPGTKIKHEGGLSG